MELLLDRVLVKLLLGMKHIEVVYSTAHKRDGQKDGHPTLRISY